MVFRLLQVFEMRVPLGASSYARPFIIVRVDPHGASGVPLSSKVETYYDANSGNQFLIDSNDPDFSRTKLACTSFVDGTHEFEMKADDVVFSRGELTGDLARRFKEWYGI